MHVRHLASAAPLVLAPLLVGLAACSGSQDTGTETQASSDGEAPAYEVVSDETTDGGQQITVSVTDVPEQLAVQDLVGDLQEDRTDDGVYELSVVCAQGDAELASATWAQGDAALEESGLSEGQIDAQVDQGATCGD